MMPVAGAIEHPLSVRSGRRVRGPTVIEWIRPFPLKQHCFVVKTGKEDVFGSLRKVLRWIGLIGSP